MTQDELLTLEDEVFVNEIAERCCGASWEKVHAEVQYTALHFQSKAKSHRLDRPELREKYKDIIDKILIAYGNMLACQIPEKFAEGQETLKQRGADLFLALIPDEEEIRRQEGERIISWLEKYKTLRRYSLRPFAEFRPPESEWQALKDGK